jgi:hypothetical protein
MWGGIVDAIDARVAAPEYAGFCALRARQPGHRGDLDADAGEGRTLHLVLWESLAAHDAAQPVLVPAWSRLVRPLLAGPMSRLGAGEVTLNTLTPGAGYIVVVEIAVAPDERAAFEEAFAAFRAVRARQPGFRGTIEFATGEGRLLLLVFRERPADRQQAAQDPAIQSGWPRVVATLGTAPAFLAAGAVTRDTIARAAPAAR